MDKAYKSALKEKEDMSVSLNVVKDAIKQKAEDLALKTKGLQEVQEANKLLRKEKRRAGLIETKGVRIGKKNI